MRSGILILFIIVSFFPSISGNNDTSDFIPNRKGVDVPTVEINIPRAKEVIMNRTLSRPNNKNDPCCSSAD